MELATTVAVNGAQQIRLAAALTALRHKPAEQSFEAYSLDLRASFPLQDADNEVHAVSSEWRARALELEGKLRDMEKKQEDDALELAALRAHPPTKSKAKDHVASAPEPTNKKAKKGQKRPASPDGLQGHQGDDVFTTKHLMPLSKLSQSSKLFSTLQTLETLTAAYTDAGLTASDAQVLFSAAERAISGLADLFSTTLLPDAIGSHGIVSSVTALLSRVLATVLPMFSMKSKKRQKATHASDYVEKLLGQLLNVILLPALHSFAPLSRRYLTALFCPTKKRTPTGPQKPTPDIRPAVFELLRTVLSVSHEAITASRPGCPGTHTMSSLVAVQHSLLLESIRLLQGLSTPNEHAQHKAPNHVGKDAAPAPSTRTRAHNPRSPSDRLENLARRDARWYVFGVAHLTIPGTMLPVTVGDSSTPRGSAASNAKQHSAPASVPMSAMMAGAEVDAALAKLREGVCTELGAFLRSLRSSEAQRARERHASAEHGLPGIPGREAESNGCAHAASADRGAPVLGPVEHDMVMALAERVWLAQE